MTGSHSRSLPVLVRHFRGAKEFELNNVVKAKFMPGAHTQSSRIPKVGGAPGPG